LNGFFSRATDSLVPDHGMFYKWLRRLREIVQGLKPRFFPALFGTTEVVP
jgi:hypothetical protein